MKLVRVFKSLPGMAVIAPVASGVMEPRFDKATSGSSYQTLAQ